MDKVEFCRKLITENIANHIITVKFIKKNGDLRTMQIHRSKELENSRTFSQPEATAKRLNTLAQSNKMVVEELVRPGVIGHQYRTLNLESIVEINCNKQSYTFDK